MDCSMTDGEEKIFVIFNGMTPLDCTVELDEGTESLYLRGLTLQYGTQNAEDRYTTTSLTAGQSLGQCALITLFGRPNSPGNFSFKIHIGETYVETVNVSVSEGLSTIPYTPDKTARIVARIEKDGVQDYLDLTFLQVQGGEVTAERAENRPGSAKFALINDWQKKNLLSDNLVWAKGTVRKLVPGIYVKIDLIEKGQYLGPIIDGYITTITAREDKIDIEIGDGIAFLGKQGTTLRRNYYNINGVSNVLLNIGVETGDTTRYYADLSGIDGIPQTSTLQWTEYDVEDTGVDGYLGRELNKVSVATIPIPSDATSLRSLGLMVGWSSLTVSDTVRAHLRVMCGSELLADSDASVYVGKSESKLLTVTLDYTKPISASSMTVYISDVGSSNSRLRVHNSSSGTIVYNGNTLSQEAYYRLEFTKWKAVTDTVSYESNRIYITATSGNGWMAPRSGTTESGRAKMNVVFGDTQTDYILADIGSHFGMAEIVGIECTARIGIFSIGGGYALDYMQKAADITDNAGRSRSFYRYGFGTERKVLVGDRYKVSDSPSMHLCYGADMAEGRIPFASFEPRLTLKGRPNLVTIRATASKESDTSSSMIIASVPANTERLESIESVIAGSNVTSQKDAVVQAYGELMSAELDQWEGQIVLPGIVLGMIATTGSHAGSGVPVEITDRRYSLSSYRARVRQVAYDFNAMTTTVTLSNFDAAYSGQIATTVALAVTGMSQAFSYASDLTSFNMQYVYLPEKEDHPYKIGTNVFAYVKKNDDTTTPIKIEDITVGILPSGKAIMQGSFIGISNAVPYGVTQISFGNGGPVLKPYPIPENLRPDAYLNQKVLFEIVLTEVEEA